MRRAISALSLVLAMPFTAATVAPASADETTGTLVAHDRKARRLVMEDRTIYEYAETTERPELLTAGMRIRIDYTGTEDGIEAINTIEVVEE